MKKIALICLIHFTSILFAQRDTMNQGLIQEIYLHPANSNTAYTFKKKECSYNQAPASLPLPSWAWVGITDWLTAEIDFLPLIGGLLVEPHIPVPSFNFRFRLKQQNKFVPAMAIETMFQYNFVKIDQATNPFFATWRKGGSWYNHLNASWKIGERFHVHASAGFTMAQFLQLERKDSVNPFQKTFTNFVSPDFSLGLDYRMKWISFHLTGTYGTTFNYLDNVPRKYELMYGIRVAPFYKNRFGFLRTFRIEWTGFYISFPEISTHVFVPIFIPYFYWQWKFK